MQGEKHHYIPVFYLKQWAGPDGRLCEFSRPYKLVKPRMTHPSGTAYVPGLYTFDDLSPQEANHLEQIFFAFADDRACLVLRRMIAGDLNFDGPAKSAWSRFIMGLMFRNPEGVQRAKQAIAEGVPQALEHFRQRYNDLRRESDPTTFDEFLASMHGDAIQRVTVSYLQRIMDSELIGTQLNRMIWTVSVLHDLRFTLLTSDRPIVMTNGLGQQTSWLVLPISPIHVFVATNTEQTMNEVVQSMKRAKFVNTVNDRVAKQARKYVYSTDDRQLRFVANRLGTKARWSPFE
jgi:hypothetical protein